MKLLESLDFVSEASDEAEAMIKDCPPDNPERVMQLRLGLMWLHCKLLQEKINEFKPE